MLTHFRVLSCLNQNIESRRGPKVSRSPEHIWDKTEGMMGDPMKQMELRKAMVVGEEGVNEEENRQIERARAEFEKQVRLYVFPYIKFPMPTERLYSHNGGNPFYFYCLGLRVDKMTPAGARAAAKRWDDNVSGFHKTIRNKRASANSALYEAWKSKCWIGPWSFTKNVGLTRLLVPCLFCPPSGIGPEGRKSLEEYKGCRAKSQDASDPQEGADEAFETFFCLVDTFMRIVNGKSHVSDDDMRTKSFEDNMMTDSTEAYVLFVLEDKWEVWEKMEEGMTKKNNKGNFPEPKYTLAAAKCSKGNSLNEDGLRQFGTLYKAVREQRKSGGADLEERVRQVYQQKYDEKRGEGGPKPVLDEKAVQAMYKDTLCEIDAKCKKEMFKNITAV